MSVQPVPANAMRTVLLSLVAGALLPSCAINPVTGERELALVSEGQEVEIGRQAAEQARTSIGLVDDDELQRYVSEVGNRIAASSERPGLPWEFQVVDDPAPNAFALPGGYIFVTRGLMTLLNSEAELAAVLGHEIGHVTARHSVNQISRAQLAEIGLGIGQVAAPEDFEEFGALAGTGLGLLFLKYGRDDERQADSLGFRYMLSHDYNVTEMGDVFAALDASSALAGASSVPSWLASHPSGPERIEELRDRVAALAPAERGSVTRADDYLRRIEGLAYGNDPRHGYFEGDSFYHPELAFQLLVPADWQRRNTASAVIAGSPEGDAAMQLALANESDLAMAASALLNQSGIRDLGTSQTTINELPALVSRFSAETQSGPIDGIATHIGYGGRIYRVLFYASAGALDRRMRLAEQISSSFASVDNRAVLDVDVPRLHIVDVDSSMTLREFSRRYPSVVPLEELALVNQLEGPESTLTPGTGAKQITG